YPLIRTSGIIDRLHLYYSGESRMFNWLKRKEQPKTEEQIEEQQHKVEEGLTRTKRGFFGQISSLFEVDEITAGRWEELERLVIQGDIGVDTTDIVLD